ncbi:alpha/beta fold hydrolase [Nocardioides marmoribigeumensis]|uniref:Pimeloyl-ACP methyl ester carboxylesterase n=1 Tax=Nocardioides marmoribigeumensis TaxID=433649 RepID=A0ABU2BZN6_9ACTN|nr:alpha/beta hydrolase [Nocardioides marmoribigeumensis]MDR7363866.1 pimeloyl-ACP methyl ester carboxylesterase [Nocardioides marmoribigeumensis]
MPSTRQVARLVGTVAGVGATGYLADQTLGRRQRRRARREDPDGLGSLRGEVHQVLTDDGIRLHAEVDEVSPYSTGQAARRRTDATVVLVHGFAMTQDCWHYQRAALRGRRRIVLYDQRSHGRSERSPDGHATIEQLGRDLFAVLTQLTGDEPVVLVGHSMGGMSIVALAEEHPELFGDKVVGTALVSTTAGSLHTHRMLSRWIPDALGRRVVERGLVMASQRERLLELVRKRGSAVAFAVIREFAFGDGAVPAAWVEFLDREIAEVPLNVLVEFIPQFDSLDKFHVVEAFAQVPTWIMCGTKDKLTSISHARKLHSRIPGSRLVELRGGGHMSLFEFKDRVNRELDDLLLAADQHVHAAEAAALGPGRATSGGAS